MRSSTSSSEERTLRVWNRHFGVTLLGLFVAAELVLRLIPQGDPRLFRAVYGNTLSMYMEIERRLEAHASDTRVLALGDSLTMTQFQPDAFADTAGLEPTEVFNAGYLGMSFPSQEVLLRTVGRERLADLDVALVFVNPRRLSPEEEPNTEIFRIANPAANHPMTELWRTKKVAPVLDHSRLYGLSRYLVMSAWRDWLSGRKSWDQVEYLQPRGGVKWTQRRESSAAPRYPYPRLETVSADRLVELEAVVALLRSWNVRVTLLVPPTHPAVDPFASAEARSRFDREIAALAARHGAVYLADEGSHFVPDDDREFSDYGHMNWSGGVSYSRALATNGAAILQDESP